MKQKQPASPAEQIADVRAELGEAIQRCDAARECIAAGVSADLGAVISPLERAETKLEELAEEVGA
jgi:hypothetical protein